MKKSLSHFLTCRAIRKQLQLKKLQNKKGLVYIMTYKINFNMATINTSLFAKGTTMTDSLFENLCHYVTLDTLEKECKNDKKYQKLINAYEKLSGDKAEKVQKISENPSVFDFKDIEEVGKALKIEEQLEKIRADLNTPDMLSAHTFWCDTLTKSADRSVVLAYAHTAEKKVIIPFTEAEGSKGTKSLKELSTLVVDWFKDTKDDSKKSKVSEKVVTESLRQFFYTVFTSEVEYFNRIKIRKSDLPTEVTRNFLARFSKGAKVNKETGVYDFTYLRNKKQIEQALTEAFAVCLTSRIDSIETEAPVK